MSQIWLPDGAHETRSAEAQFLDLLLADDDLVQAEFDAIIAAGIAVGFDFHAPQGLTSRPL